MTHPFRCPACLQDALSWRAADGHDGAFVCDRCGGWYPVQDEVADFSPADARDEVRWRQFWERYGRTLDLPAPETSAGSANVQTQRAFFDGFVDDYDRIVDETSFWRGHDRLAVQSWVRTVPRDADVIDLGAGSGRCTVPLADHLGPGGQLVAVDVSFEMLRAAAEKLRREGKGGRATLVVGDCTRMEFLRSDSFDVAFSYGLLHHIEEPEPVWTALDRIMRPRANVLIHDNNDTALRRAFDALMGRRRLWDAEHEGHPVISLRDLRRWARGHGFAIHARTSVFVPPHLCNMLSAEASYRLLASSDALMSRVPRVARHGGLILGEAFRGGSPLVMTTQPRAAA